MTAEERFWAKVKKRGDNECWTWTGHISEFNGYGQFSHEGRTVSAHKFSYELTHGPIYFGLVVMHTCDNRSCMNPKHLVTGTSMDNSRDAVDKKRIPRGPDHYRYKHGNYSKYRDA